MTSQRACAWVFFSCIGDAVGGSRPSSDPAQSSLGTRDDVIDALVDDADGVAHLLHPDEVATGGPGPLERREGKLLVRVGPFPWPEKKNEIRPNCSKKKISANQTAGKQATTLNPPF